MKNKVLSASESSTNAWHKRYRTKTAVIDRRYSASAPARTFSAALGGAVEDGAAVGGGAVGGMKVFGDVAADGDEKFAVFNNGGETGEEMGFEGAGEGQSSRRWEEDGPLGTAAISAPGGGSRRDDVGGFEGVTGPHSGEALSSLAARLLRLREGLRSSGRLVPHPIFCWLVREIRVRAERPGEVVDGDMAIDKEDRGHEPLAGIHRIVDIASAHRVVPLRPKPRIKPGRRFMHQNIALRLRHPIFALQSEPPAEPETKPTAFQQRERATIIVITASRRREISRLFLRFTGRAQNLFLPFVRGALVNRRRPHVIV
jgi:hypothetical protein